MKKIDRKLYISRIARKLGYTAISYARHPFGITCLDCGFLTVVDNEVSTADRLLLSCRQESIPLEKLWCSRRLWIDYELCYDGCAESIFKCLEKQRRNCEGFFRYRPGWSPSGHLDLLLRAQDKREKIFILCLGIVLGALSTLLVSWLAK